MHQFSCIKDEDIKYYLVYNSVDYERRHKSRTFFVLDEEDFYTGKIKLYAFFSLAQKVLTLPENISKSKRKRMDGYSSYYKGEVIRHFPVFLIGQLAKNYCYEKDISGEEVLEFAINTIRSAQDVIGGRVVLVECKDIDKLLDFYSRFGFEVINNDDDGLVQMIAFL